VKLMREKGESLKAACETLGTSRSGQYPKTRGKTTSVLNQVLVEKLKELRLAHPFWGYRRMTAWLRYREGTEVNHKRIQRLMRDLWEWIDRPIEPPPGLQEAEQLALNLV